jgi:hypothetical protein
MRKSAVPAPTDEALQPVSHKIITRTMKLLTRRGVLVEKEGATYMADIDGDSDEAHVSAIANSAGCQREGPGHRGRDL